MRLRRIEVEFGGRVTLEWRAFLLRPRPDPGRPLEKFRAYTQSWLRPASEPDAPAFRPWTTTAGPPSHSIPPHLVAKAAAALGAQAHAMIHERLLRAYFAENRDITDPETLRALWADTGLPAAAFARSEDDRLRREVLDEHRDGIGQGLNGVPAVMMVGNDVPIVGAMPYATYRRWIERRLAEDC